MKKLFAVLLALLLILPAGGAALAAETGAGSDPVSISDAAGLLALAEDPSGSYVLTADIDMTGVDWTPIAFSGSLDGGGHTLYNLRVTDVGAEVRVTRDGNLKPYDTVFAGLFSVLEGATVQNLSLLGAELTVDGHTHCFAGLLAGYMDQSSLQGCSVQGHARLNNYAVQSGLGGLVGYGCGEIRDCRADVELVFEDLNFDSRCEQFMGGILSCGIANIEGCTVLIDGYDSCHGYVHNGGLVGMYYYCGMTFRGLTVMGNDVTGQISFFEDNPNRRAYCAPFLGEPLSMPGNYYNNTEAFTRNETFDYDTVLLPERCELPEIRDTVTPPDCDSWGYVDHSCAVCGHSWRDSYFPPQHTPGEWETVREAAPEADGLREQRCSLCGELLASEPLAYVPPETPGPIQTAAPAAAAEGDTLRGVESSEVLGVFYRGQARAMRSVAAPDQLQWSSDDPTIASVDQNGTITGLRRGTTTVHYSSADGLYTGACEVQVLYSYFQWFLILFCFGWLWYI